MKVNAHFRRACGHVERRDFLIVEEEDISSLAKREIERPCDRCAVRLCALKLFEKFPKKEGNC
ncbi:MAG: hypothetical protein ABSB32_06020 [Thermodesulfobacteriota bacterium]|jgi:hypothetical protein